MDGIQSLPEFGEALNRSVKKKKDVVIKVDALHIVNG